jgi:hypothetical protein
LPPFAISEDSSASTSNGSSSTSPCAATAPNSQVFSTQEDAAVNCDHDYPVRERNGRAVCLGCGGFVDGEWIRNLTATIFEAAAWDMAARLEADNGGRGDVADR